LKLYALPQLCILTRVIWLLLDQKETLKWGFGTGKLFGVQTLGVHVWLTMAPHLLEPNASFSEGM
jgi:hypothetical protein